MISTIIYNKSPGGRPGIDLVMDIIKSTMGESYHEMQIQGDSLPVR